MKIIITDLTRFANDEIVCMAGIEESTLECIRPMPYIKKDKCRDLNILPGAIIDGDFVNRQCTSPHIEDRSYSKLKFYGPCSSDEFRNVLDKSSYKSAEDGFETVLSDNQKCIDCNVPIAKSIITLSLNPKKLDIVEDRYNYGKLRVNFDDGNNKKFRFLSITDLGFYEYALKYAKNNKIYELNSFIHKQRELYIRLGLSRQYTSDDGRSGYWMQVNGVYTFPEFNTEIRSYK